jgi:putative membrane protein
MVSEHGTGERKDKTVNLGFERTRLAADRTLMAWIRTSVSMISFGFTIYKFFQYILETNLSGRLTHNAPRNFGVVLVVLGMLLLALAIVEYFLFLRKLSLDTGEKFTVSTALVAALLLSLVGILVLVNLIFNMGPI